jgi:hypothetical protein
MSHANPPSAARWMLDHLMPGEANEALAGDLLEEFHAGRSAAWYWRQVLSALSIRCARELRIHCTALLFAALWSMLAPAWLLAIARLERSANLNAHLAQLNWPWNQLGSFAFMLAANLLFLWTGVALYMLPEIWLRGKLTIHPLTHGIAASLPVLLVAWLALIVLPLHFVAANSAQPAVAPTPLEAAHIDNQNVWAAYDRQLAMRQLEMQNQSRALPQASPRNGAIDLRPATMLLRLPFFLVILCTLWSSARRSSIRQERA